MERKRIAIILIVIIVASPMAVLLIDYIDMSSHEIRGDTWGHFDFVVADLEDAVVNIEFVNDPTLILRYMYSLYPDSPVGFKYIWDINMFYILRDGDSPVRVQYFNITFGTHPPSFHLDNLHNCSVYVLCNNNANLTGVNWDIHGDDHSGIFFGLDNDTSVGSSPFDCLLHAGLVLLVVNLPSQTEAEVSIYSPMANVWEWDGWVRDTPHYTSPDMTYPYIDIVVEANECHAWLYL